jgi:hypothetical protein
LHRGTKTKKKKKKKREPVPFEKIFSTTPSNVLLSLMIATLIALLAAPAAAQFSLTVNLI